MRKCKRVKEAQKQRDFRVMGKRVLLRRFPKGLQNLIRTKFDKKLSDLLSKSIIIDSITNEFASFQLLRNDMVSSNLIA